MSVDSGLQTKLESTVVAPCQRRGILISVNTEQDGTALPSIAIVATNGLMLLAASVHVLPEQLVNEKAHHHLQRAHRSLATQRTILSDPCVA